MKGTIAGAYAAARTNPVTTLGNAGRSIAGMIDTAITAEDTPARVQASRAVNAVANASPRDIGRATGTVAGNLMLAAAPGAALAKVSRLRRLRMARPGAGAFLHRRSDGSGKIWVATVQRSSITTRRREPGLAKRRH